MDAEGRVCQVCQAPKPHLLCLACSKKFYLAEKTDAKLRDRTRRKVELEALLQQALQKQNLKAEHETALASARQALGAAKLKTSQACVRREQVRLDLKHERSRYARCYESSTQALQKIKTEHSSSNKRVTEELKTRRFHLLVVEKQLREQLRKHVRLLLEILPVGLVGPLPSGSSTRGSPANAPSPSISICGCQLTPSLPSMASSTSLKSLSTALGYMTLLLRELSSLLMAPRLVHLHYNASTSLIWNPSSFWEDRPGERSRVLRLFLAEPVAMPPMPQTTPSAVSASGRALNAITRHWPWEKGFKVTALAPPKVTSAKRQRDEMATGMYQLMRTAGAIQLDHSLHFQPPLPAHWNTFASIAGLCMQLASENSSGPGSSTFNGRQWAQDSTRNPGSESTVGDAELFEEEVDDGWDMVQRPGRVYSTREDALRLPPAPSDGDELITHWERAMITDSSSLPHRPAQPAAFDLGRRLPSLGQGARAAADRLLQGFKPRSLG